MDPKPDVVFYANAEWDMWVCQDCKLGTPHELFHDEAAAHEHLREHKRAGHRMPHGYQEVWPDLY